MRQGQILVNDCLVNYYCFVAAPRLSSTVIFLHGWRNNAMVWLPILKAAVSGRLFNFYALDLPGFGQSQIPAAPWTLQDYATAIQEFIRKLDLTAVVLVGHSFGGRVAIKLAALHPEVFRRLVLVSSGGWRRGKIWRQVVLAIAKILKPAFALPLIRRARPGIYNLLGGSDYLAAPALRATFLNIIKEDITLLLPAVRQPTLILWGEDDREVPLAFARVIAAGIAGSKLQTFAKARHFVFLDQPDKFLRSLTAFINEPV